ncbi:PREDICTED: immortalization up-regulated protein [Chinchilla lanigera]|uniref:immortalization up-regulated protein n=1 Tax=Chinchilla lanigera TaxID=34839 RepID=UPI00038EB9FB|nr:PREDICTED: immortalization up-regulated protein [Chinchilla lanigera]
MDFSLAAALDSNSKKKEGACKLGDPKHGPPKAQGGPGAGQKPRHGHGSSSDSSSSSSDSDSEGKPHAAGSQQHKGTADKTKKPKMKKDKKQKDKKGKKEAKH